MMNKRSPATTHTSIRTNIAGTSLALTATTLLFLTPAISWASHCADPVATAISVQGIVEEKIENQWAPVKRGDGLCAGDILRVRSKSRAIVRMHAEQTNITLSQNTTLSFSAKKEKSYSLIELFKGVANFISRVPQSLKVKTPYVNAAVEGTEFLISVKNETTKVSVFEGHVALNNPQGELKLVSGETGLTEEKQAPGKTSKVNQMNAVQWSLYYPPIISKPAHAKEGLVPFVLQDKNDPQLITWYAAQLLSVGRVKLAEVEINKALALDNGDSNALALKAIIAVVKNDSDTAIKLAKQAIQNNGNVAGLIALSYAHQSRFSLDKALDAATEATKIEPVNAIAWARLAELHLTQANLDAALSTANKATSLDPELARTHTILGFSHLTRIDTKNARLAFNKAISLDQASPLPHLGLGLAMIRDGELATGRAEIEAATSLDTQNSLIRSYMGKAYYEEGRLDLAATQFDIAKQLDPKDPTPWFYDAILKQLENDPISALADLQKSQQLNNNRGVYRSKLLLDQDEAAKDVNQAKIYQELGFNQLALLEGTRALTTDPTNHSAHRFLSDSYASLPRHEIARVSELLQAQLLQPVTATPIQPHLLESNLGIFADTGPSAAALNEYNPLFTSNGLRATTSFITGGDDSDGGEIVISNLYGNTVVTASGYQFETQGFRANNDQDIHIGSVFVQSDLEPTFSIQAEYRNTEILKGSTILRFDPTNFSALLRETIDTEEKRFGFKGNYSNDSILLGSIIIVDEDRTLNDGPFSFDSNEKGNLVELQHIFKTNTYTVKAGVNSFKSDLSNTVTTILPFPPFAPFTTIENSSIDHENFYIYSDTNISNTVINIGASYDLFKGIEKIDQFNPKIGATWNINQNTSLRIAAFRTLKRRLLSDKTLEPTNISGFNQLYDDGEGTISEQVNLGFDTKLSKNKYFGIEVSKRELTVPFLSFPPPPAPPIPTVSHADVDEEFARLYFNFLLSKNSALAIDYYHENFDRPSNFPGDGLFTSLTTQRLPINYKYHRENFTFNLKTTYVKQDGTFVSPPFFTASNDKDDFSVTDLELQFSYLKGRAILSISSKNIFDKDFNFQDTDRSKPTVYPNRIVLTEFSMSFN